jgi:hypothetical protein
VSDYADGLDRRLCDGCGRRFIAGFDWMTTCRVCFHERHGDPDLALAELAWERGYALALERVRRRDDADIEAALGALPLRALISLCHPDRHPPERFDEANQITTWLLSLRDSR